MTSVELGAPHRLGWDDLAVGFAIAGEGARCTHQAAGPHVAGGGLPTVSAAGLRVVASGCHPLTGALAFVRTVDRHLPSREHPVLDHGGVEATLTPAQLNCGLALFTLLDAGPGTPPGGLVRLCPEDGVCADPWFAHDDSRPGSRLSVTDAAVSRTPTDPREAS